MKKVMICGIDCRPGDQYCNNYCRDARVKSPPEATLDQIKAAALRYAAEELGKAVAQVNDFLAVSEPGSDQHTEATAIAEAVQAITQRIAVLAKP